MDTHERPDIQIITDSPARHVLVDVMITNDTRESESTTAAGVMAKMVATKTAKYADMCRVTGSQFVAFVCSVHGGLAKEAKLLIRDMAVHAVNRRVCVDYVEFMREAMAEVAAAIANFNYTLVERAHRLCMERMRRRARRRMTAAAAADADMRL
jgi:hypothetical protein